MTEGQENEEPNPFKGTPFEHLFQAGGEGGFAFVPDLGQLFSQMQSFMTSGPDEGPVNWTAALDIARRQLAAAGPDPSPTDSQKARVDDAIRLADHWLDGTTVFPSGIVSATAWARAEWVHGTEAVWRTLVEPIAESSVATMSEQFPAEMRALAGAFTGIIGKAAGAMIAAQAGAGLAALAGDVLSATDIGIPLTEPGRSALVLANVASFGEGLGVPAYDVTLYCALREAAHQRLFAGVPWLREHLVDAVRSYARGLEVNLTQVQQQVEEQLRGVDLNDPESLQQLFSEGMFDVPRSPAQQAALSRLEVTLALVEGWVDEVVTAAVGDRMPSAVKLQEAMRRRRATGGPAEQAFAQLIGLELRPRRLRDASVLWGSLRARQGIEARDGVWLNPALLPRDADLDDPLGFREGAELPEDIDAIDFDEELRKLTGGPATGPETGEGA